jgi:hypothetical protein
MIYTIIHPMNVIRTSLTPIFSHTTLAQEKKSAYFGALFNTTAMSLSYVSRTFLFGLLLFSGGLAAQTYSPLAQLKTVKNNAVQRIVNSEQGVYVKQFPKHGSVTHVSIGGNNFLVTYTPFNGFVGTDTFQIEKIFVGIPPVSFYDAFRVSVFNSILNANTDFSATVSGTPVTMNLIANDSTTSGGNLTISNIPSKNHGNLVINSDNTVTFTPAVGFVGAAGFNYVVCDNVGTCETGSALVAVSPNQNPTSDPMFVSTAKNARVDIPLSHAGFYISQNPNHGTATINGGFLVNYAPSNNFVGSDTLLVVNTSFGTAIQKEVIISVFNYATPNKFAIDDYAWTPKNVPVTINVRPNDLGFYSIMGFTAPNANQGSVSPNPSIPGQFIFTPAANFSGVATFKYKVGNAWQSVVETGTVFVMVGNMNPSAATFHLTTPVDVPMVINYQIPFIGFDFAITQSPTQGNVVIYPGFQTITVNNQSVSGNNLLVYTPTGGYSGVDEFEINYCVGATGQCANVKLDVDIVEINSNSGTFCVDGCVWAGDINDDGIVNNKDILPLGYFMGEKGLVRPDASLEWYGQGAPNWANPYVGTPIDLKHVDTDGNGDINAADTTAIGQFYGKTHALTPIMLPPNKGLPFSLKMLNSGPVGIGDLVQIEVSLGSQYIPVTNLYGFTFDMKLSPQIVDSLFQMHFKNDSWMTFNAPVLHFQKRPTVGKLETALTHTNGQNASGFGVIGTVDFIIIDVVDLFTGQVILNAKSNTNVVLTANMQLLDANGQTYSLEDQLLEIQLKSGKNNQPATSVSDADLFASPNPASDYVSLHLNGNNEIENLRILNATGQEVWNSGEVSWKTADVPVRDLESGVYFFHAITKAGKVVKKVNVIR